MDTKDLKEMVKREKSKKLTPNIFSFSDYANRFDEHIDKSIRGFADLREDVAQLSRFFIKNKCSVLELGCSQGTTLRRIRDVNSDHAKEVEYYGIDINHSFQSDWKVPNEPEMHFNIMDAEDLRDAKEFQDYSQLRLVISIFTMQFLLEENRQQIYQNIFESLPIGGGFIIAEKVLSQYSRIQNMMDSMQLQYKRQNFTDKEILDKEHSLQHLLKPTYLGKLKTQLEDVGFGMVESFWRNFNFLGFVCIKTSDGFNEGNSDEQS